MFRRASSWVLCIVVLGISSGMASAEVGRRADRRSGQASCQHCGVACSSCQLCEHTVMVPMMVTETRMKPCVVRKQVEREETYTVFQRVPVKRTYTKEKCYLADEVRTKTITEEKCHRVSNSIVSDYPVHVPVTEVRQHNVPQEVCTEDGVAIVEQPCEETVTVLREEWRSTTCCKEDVVFEKTKRDIDYCVRVPKTQKVVCAEETEYKLVPIEKTRKVLVCVPEIVETPVEVTVCKLVPRTMMCCERCCGKGK